MPASPFRHCILDEVDRMLDMGFQDSVEEILAASYTTGVIFDSAVPVKRFY